MRPAASGLAGALFNSDDAGTGTPGGILGSRRRFTGTDAGIKHAESLTQQGIRGKLIIVIMTNETLWDAKSACRFYFSHLQ